MKIILEHARSFLPVYLFAILIVCNIGYSFGEVHHNTTAHDTTILHNGEGFKPTKKISMILEDTEIEIDSKKKIKVWAFNGTVPGPTLRFTEGDNISILFINNGTYPHTMHFHGFHDDKNDGVLPVIMPGKTYTYNITAEPAGALMYHCHVPPVSEHIRMGMYGALIIDPRDTPLKPAREFYMVMSEFSIDDKNVTKFIADYYPVNGYSYQYIYNPLVINQDEILRLYIINIGTTISAPFHLHSTIFDVYPSGLLSNKPYQAQTVAISPGDTAIIEAKWKYPGEYMFHSHGFQEERGNMGHITVKANTSKLVESISMFDWQYEIQKKLQNGISK